MKSTLSQIADIRMGYLFRSRVEHENEGKIAVVQMKDIDENNRINIASASRLDLPDAQPQHFIENGDLIFRSRGVTNLAALATEIMEPTVLAAPLIRIRPRTVLPEYLLFYMNLDSTQIALSEFAEGTSTRMISKASLEKLVIPMLSNEQQRKMVELSQMQQKEKILMTEIMRQRKRLAEGILMHYARNTR